MTPKRNLHIVQDGETHLGLEPLMQLTDNALAGISLVRSEVRSEVEICQVST